MIATEDQLDANAYYLIADHAVQTFLAEHYGYRGQQLHDRQLAHLERYVLKDGMADLVLNAGIRKIYGNAVFNEEQFEHMRNIVVDIVIAFTNSQRSNYP